MSDGNFTNAIPRDRYDRPFIYPKPARGKTHADVIAQFEKRKKKPPSYRRTTKFISVLEDTYTLDKWGQRMVARGIAERDDLAEAARGTELDTKSGKDALDRIVSDARAHMRTGLKASLGSYLHHCTQVIDENDEWVCPDDLPSPTEWASLQKGNVDLLDDDYPLDERDADLDAYIATKRRYGMTYSAIEQMRVFDPWEVAGTPDRIGTGTDDRFAGKWLIEDVKTGDIDWDNSQREIGMQLAMYAHSTGYTQDGGRVEDVPPVCRLKAVVIHLPVMQAKCELHFVDIVAGWEGCQSAQAVWQWRKRKGVFTKLDEWAPRNHLERNSMRPSFAEEAMQCDTKDALRALWTKAAEGISLTPDFKAAVKKRLEQLESAA